MEQIRIAKEFSKDFLEKHHEHKEEVDDMFQLMVDEIEQGESPQNELELFCGACEDLLID